MNIHIDNLRLRTIIGIEDWERKSKQDVIINITLTFDGQAASQSDDINDTVDYKLLSKEIISHVESSHFKLLEKLADSIATICLESKGVKETTVRVDKPFALRFADSVAVEITKCHT